MNCDKEYSKYLEKTTLELYQDLKLFAWLNLLSLVVGLGIGVFVGKLYVFQNWLDWAKDRDYVTYDPDNGKLIEEDGSKFPNYRKGDSYE